jgi:hypothetical protein
MRVARLEVRRAVVDELAKATRVIHRQSGVLTPEGRMQIIAVLLGRIKV